MPRNLQKLKRTIRRLMDQKVVLQTPTPSVDGGGGEVLTFSSLDTEGTQLRCNLQPLSSREQNEYARQELEVTHACYTDEYPGDVTGKRLVWVDLHGRTRYLTDLSVREPGEVAVFWTIIGREEQPP